MDAKAHKQKVFVAMSGGVDSSVAAALLKKQGYDIYGVFMQGWINPRFECQWKEDRRDAARVAAVLGIPFRALDFSREYYERVVSYLIAEYKAGRTPNPDVMCNKEIKFGLFYRWAVEQGADYIATGHYIRKSEIRNPNFALFTAKDANKDQSYFLWTLTPEIISRSLFPIEDYKKSEVRELAHAFGLPTADKKDSQGLCFVGSPASGGSMADFLRDHIVTRRGEIKTASGKRVGEHDGIELYTIGQRHGIGAPGGSGGPFYVAEKDLQAATLVVAESSADPILYRKELRFHSANWLMDVSRPFSCEARIRYRQPLEPCVVFDGCVIFNKPVRAIAPGQSVVFYKDGPFGDAPGKQLLGGGVID